MPQPPFVSSAPNREDVVLWRALGEIPGGRYVEIGANHPEDASVAKAFDERGWRGITIEPAQGATDPTARSEDILTDAGCAPEDAIHFLVIDAGGAEADVLASIDLRTWRPWVLVVNSTAPDSTEQTQDAWEPEVLAAGYKFCLFDGRSRFYVADEHDDRLKDALSYPACPRDSFVARSEAVLLDERRDLLSQAAHWRTIALGRWADAAAQAVNEEDDAEAERLRAEIAAIQHTLSWRITRPLRAVRSVVGRVRGR